LYQITGSRISWRSASSSYEACRKLLPICSFSGNFIMKHFFRDYKLDCLSGLYCILLLLIISTPTTILVAQITYNPWKPVAVDLSRVNLNRGSIPISVSTISPAPGADTATAWTIIYQDRGIYNGKRVFLRTTDGGNVWNADTIPDVPQPGAELLPTTSGLTNISAISATSAIAGLVDADLFHFLDSAYSKIVRTDDGGRTWRVIDSIKTNAFLTSVVAINATHYVASYEGTTNSLNSSFLRSTGNGGATWIVTSIVRNEHVSFVLSGGASLNSTDSSILFPVGFITDAGTGNQKINNQVIEFKALEQGGMDNTYWGNDLDLLTTSGNIFLALSLGNTFDYAVEPNPHQGKKTGRIYRRVHALGAEWGPITPDHFISGHLEARGAIAQMSMQTPKGGFRALVTTANNVWTSDHRPGCAISFDDGLTWTSVDTTNQFSWYSLAFSGRTGWAGGISRNQDEPLYIYKWEPQFINSAEEYTTINGSMIISPNPAENYITITGAKPVTEGTLVSLRIMSLDGTLLQEKKIVSTGEDFNIDIDTNGLGVGMYLVQLQYNDKIKTEKFVKM